MSWWFWPLLLTVNLIAAIAGVLIGFWLTELFMED